MLPPPVGVYLALKADGILRELIDILPLELSQDLKVILGWDMIFSHYLKFVYPSGRVADTGQTGFSEHISCRQYYHSWPGLSLALEYCVACFALKICKMVTVGESETTTYTPVQDLHGGPHDRRSSTAAYLNRPKLLRRRLACILQARLDETVGSAAAVRIPRLCVPDRGNLCRCIIQECNDTLLGWHFERCKTASVLLLANSRPCSVCSIL